MCLNNSYVIYAMFYLANLYEHFCPHTLIHKMEIMILFSLGCYKIMHITFLVVLGTPEMLAVILMDITLAQTKKCLITILSPCLKSFYITNS